MNCNIDKSDRINRIVFGVIFLLGALLGFGKIFFIVCSLVLIIEGIIGWCGIPLIYSKIKSILK